MWMGCEYMKEWIVWAGTLVLVLSLAANIYLYQQTNKTRHYVEFAVGSAASLLNSSATMQIIPNTLNNSPSVRGLQVGEAASYLASAAPFLDELGIYHMQGIASILTGDSFPMMFPNQMRNLNTNQMLTLVRYSSKQLNACFQNGKLDFGKLQTAINNIYQQIPAQYRQGAYSDTSP